MRVRLIATVVRAACVGVLGAMLPVPALAIVNGQEPHNSDTRLDAVAAFSITTWINGVEQEHNTFGCGTLIAPDTVILARHLLWSSTPEFSPPPPPGYYSFRFRRKADGTVGSIAQGWQSFHQVSVREFIIPDQSRYQDIVFAKLSEPVTHIQPMALAPLGKITSLIPGSSVINIAGWGKEGPGMDQGDRGRLLFAQPTLSSLTCASIGFPSAWEPQNTCACGPNMHDSGGAILIGGEEGAPYSLAGVIGTYWGGGRARPSTSPPDPAASPTDRRHDAIVAFGPTAWLSEEAPGQLPGDGDSFEHEHRYTGVLISPTQVLLPVDAIGMANPNYFQYSTAQPPPAGLFSVRLRRQTGGGVGSTGAGWASYHQVAVQSFTADPSPEGTRFVIANLAQPVTHIAPMTIAPTAAVQAMNAGTPLRVSGWTWADGTGSDMQSRADTVAERGCAEISLAGPGGTGLNLCGVGAYNPGSAIVVERRRRLFSVVPVDELPQADVTWSGGDGGEPVILLDGPPEGDARFVPSTPIEAEWVTVTWFELVALTRQGDSTSGQLVRASQLFDRCFYAVCSRPPFGPVDKCADLNGDGQINQADMDLIIANRGACADCGNCPWDLNHDCVVDRDDQTACGEQITAGRCPCRADFDGNGVVDVTDLDYLIRRFGVCDCLDPCPADLNGDRVVDELDVDLFNELPASICTY